MEAAQWFPEKKKTFKFFKIIPPIQSKELSKGDF